MLESLKKDVVAMAKRAQKEGLCKHLSGNLSARDPETGYVVITPTQVDRDLLTARDMVVLDLDANVIENESGLRPTSESLMHLQIYKTRPDVNAIAGIQSACYAEALVQRYRCECNLPYTFYVCNNIRCIKQTNSSGCI